MIDELDKKILAVMQKDCRKSFREIAKDVNSTAVTVINRVRKMEKAGIIKGYAVDIEYAKIGYGTSGVINVIAETGGLKKIEEDVRSFNNVFLTYEVTGDTDVVLVGKFKDLHDLQAFVKEKLLTKSYIQKTSTHIVTNIYKETPVISVSSQPKSSAQAAASSKRGQVSLSRSLSSTTRA